MSVFFVICQPRPVINKLIKCAILRISCIYAQNIPFMGVYQDVLLLLSTFLHQWFHIYCRIQNTNTNYNDENTRICLSTRKRLDRHPWRVCFERWKKKYHKIAQVINLLLFIRLFLLLSIATYPSWMSIKTFSCGQAYSCIPIIETCNIFLVFYNT